MSSRKWWAPRFGTVLQHLRRRSATVMLIGHENPPNPPLVKYVILDHPDRIRVGSFPYDEWERLEPRDE